MPKEKTSAIYLKLQHGSQPLKRTQSATQRAPSGTSVNDMTTGNFVYDIAEWLVYNMSSLVWDFSCQDDYDWDTYIEETVLEELGETYGFDELCFALNDSKIRLIINLYRSSAHATDKVH